MSVGAVSGVDEFPTIAGLVEKTVNFWPEHQKFLNASLKNYSKSDLELLEILALKIHVLAANNLDSYIESYRFICDVFNDEQLYFMRHKTYRCADFGEANSAVYSNADFMKKYMEGLLLSQLFWQNHAKFFLFHTTYLRSVKQKFSYLEIGPGHGLYLANAASSDKCVLAEGWDVSRESLSQTSMSLKRMGVVAPVKLEERDVQVPVAADNGKKFDILVISEVLEHLEKPVQALQSLRQHLSADGRIMINFPINSPAPDHIFLLRSEKEVVDFVEGAGLSVKSVVSFPSTGYSLERANAIQASVTCVIVAKAKKTNPIH